MGIARIMVLLAGPVLSGCAAAPQAPQFRGFDLALTHPSPYATYMLVSPVTRGAKLPHARAMESRGFAMYLRSATGCARNTGRDISVLGDIRAPAGYMVPIICP